MYVFVLCVGSSPMCNVCVCIMMYKVANGVSGDYHHMLCVCVGSSRSAVLCMWDPHDVQGCVSVSPPICSVVGVLDRHLSHMCSVVCVCLVIKHVEGLVCVCLSVYVCIKKRGVTGGGACEHLPACMHPCYRRPSMLPCTSRIPI